MFFSRVLVLFVASIDIMAFDGAPPLLSYVLRLFPLAFLLFVTYITPHFIK